MEIGPDGILPEELGRATEKLRKADERTVKLEGGGASTGARKLAQKHITEFTDGLQGVLWGKNPEVYRKLLPRLRELDRSVLALCILQGALHSISHGEPLIPKTVKTIGEYLYNECWAAGLIKRAPKVARAIESYAKKKSSSVKARRKAAQTEAGKAGYKFDKWEDPSDYMKVGMWAVNALTATLPTIFVITELQERIAGHLAPQRYLVLTDEAEAYIDYVVAEVVLNNPVWLPVLDKPPRWSALDEGGSADPRLRLTFIRKPNENKLTAKAVREAIQTGQLRPALDAVNALQSVPWKINERVLAVLKAHPPVQRQQIKEPAKTKPWDDMSGAEKRHLMQIRKANKSFKSDYSLFVEDMKIAERLVEHPRFYTAMNLDWRGRVYGAPSFNFLQRDRVRALFLFAEGEPIGEEGLYWLKVHVANCGDFDKISKRPFDERISWVDQHLKEIRRTANDPLSDEWWRTGVDDPYLFLAACFELTLALQVGPTYKTHLPITFDGSCNGIQHQCAMMRGSEGSLVNLIPGPPQDIYEAVAVDVERRVKEDLKGDDIGKQQLAKQWCAYGITRKLVKRGAMTFGYGSNRGGMANQLREDVMEKAAIGMLEGKLKSHPFGGDDDNDLKASNYLAKHIYHAVKAVAHSSADVKHFLRGLSNVLSDENKPLQWITPVGLPWINLYRQRPNNHTGQVRLWLHDRGMKTLVKTHLKEYLPTINKLRAANGASPNFVHACDAAHLMLTVNAAVEEGITSIATVHDSFGCLASQASRFREIIREQFVKMYEEHDVLQEVLEQAKEDLGDPKGLPTKPERGQLDIRGVLKAEYAFA